MLLEWIWTLLVPKPWNLLVLYRSSNSGTRYSNTSTTVTASKIHVQKDQELAFLILNPRVTVDYSIREFDSCAD